MNIVASFRKDLRKCADPKKAIFLKRFFKTGPGQYGEGDQFLGVTVPHTRAVVKIYVKQIDLKDIEELLFSQIHEERLAAVILLVEKYRKGDAALQREIFDFYIKHAKQVNNWDLVDSSAVYIVGAHLEGKSKVILTKLARSKNVWERRIAIISTFYYIKLGRCEDALHIARILVGDKHDLIQKAVGWMLREVGKRCGREMLEVFLKQHYHECSRTTLRYAIEHFPVSQRKKYLAGEF